jgi:BirA family biotin operon repressor/biotin-[acetyl-CoA-carboxylase] ligase
VICGGKAGTSVDGVRDSLAPDGVVPLLRGRFGRDYRYAERTASTQRLLEDASEGAVAVAEEQTEGRGRLGRSWQAKPGTSVLVSLLLEPPVAAAKLPGLTLVAAEACAEAIAAVTGLEPAIKHPNDVLVDGRKVAGILAEAREGRVVLGIGINVNAREDELPTETETPAGSLLLAVGRELSRVELVVELLVRLERRYDAWTARAR